MSTMSTRRHFIAAALALCALQAHAQDKACTVLLVHPAGSSAVPLAGLAKKLQSGCTAHTVAPAVPGDLAKPVKQARQQGAKRVLLVGLGAGGNLAMAYAGTAGDVEGVAALAPEDKSLPALAAAMPQHAPLLWVVGAGEPLAAKAEAYLSKAPPHPASRVVTVKADAAALPDASAKAVTQWMKDAE
jgi:dienelactone hydrolase